ncbi:MULTISPECIES: UDP-2,3-diacylglucosamine diphosphatase [Candidatus Cardinium]|uniref:UDP-2,3-diacylglucosamine diphosphatase n=1 Tax=Candidatus Cardinium TaxID=273135 RepID=UPI001FAA2B57|nr:MULTISPECIES: UDP-2,3-diacylglucosamine diphosphatase [Cardinium]
MIELTQLAKKVFFISDLHLPLCPSGINRSRALENKLLAWLDYIKPQAEALFLLGDVFDFWFEYKYLIPKGAIRFQVKLWEFVQNKIPVYLFLGNHDGWSIDYLIQECGVQLFRKPASITICNRKFFLGHGDTIGPTMGYTLLRRLYHSRWFQSFVRILPPDWIYNRVDHYLTKKKGANPSFFAKKDRIFHYCEDKIEPFNHHDFYIFGHTHCPYIKALNHSSSYCNLGDWVFHYTYACFDGDNLSLLTF